MAWRTIRGRRVKVRSGRAHRSRHSAASRSRPRFIFGSSLTPSERLAVEREKAKRREEKAQVKAIRRESKARAKAYKRIGKERAKAERLRVLREEYQQED